MADDNFTPTPELVREVEALQRELAEVRDFVRHLAPTPTKTVCLALLITAAGGYASEESWQRLCDAAWMLRGME
jgi:hypothetical protein